MNKRCLYTLAAWFGAASSQPSLMSAQDAGLASIAMGLTEGSRTLKDVGPPRANAGVGMLSTAAPTSSIVIIPKYQSVDGSSSFGATFAWVRGFTSGTALQFGVTGTATDGESETVKSYAPSARVTSPKFGNGRFKAAATGIFAQTVDGGSRATATSALDFTVPTASSGVAIVVGATASLVRMAPEVGAETSQGVATASLTLTQALIEARIEYQPKAGAIAETYLFAASSDFGKRTPLIVATAAKGSVFSLAMRFTR